MSFASLISVTYAAPLSSLPCHWLSVAPSPENQRCRRACACVSGTYPRRALWRHGYRLCAPRSCLSREKATRRSRCPKILKVGSDSSGMDAFSAALKRMRISHEVLFASDTNLPCRKILDEVRPTKTPAQTSTCGRPLAMTSAPSAKVLAGLDPRGQGP